MQKIKIFIFVLLVLSLASISTLAQKNKKEIEHAPLPRIILDAKNVFLVNSGGSDPTIKDGEGTELVFDTIYSDFKEWNKYTLVDNPEAADIIIEVSYGAENSRTRVWSSTNTATNTTQVHSGTVADATIRMVIYNSKNKDALWSTSIVRDLARREKNRKKNAINAAHTLIEKFKERVTPK